MPELRPVELVRINRLCLELVFADGIGSSGKGMLSHILGSLERVEKQCNHTPFDFVAYIHWLGKITDDAASTYLQTEADQQLYHIMMSRDVNFRPKDSTGVLQNAFPWKYFTRLFMAEGDSVLERIRTEKPILNEAPHDALRSAPLFFRTFGSSLRIIYVIRNPYELILDWKRRGFGQRIGVDPREFQFSVRIDGKTVPMFMMRYSDFDYDALTDLERLVLMIHFCFKTNLDGYLGCSTDHQSHVLVTSFDDLCVSPMQVVDRICAFLGVAKTRHTSRVLRWENLPRPRSGESSYREQVASRVDSRFETYLRELDEMYSRFLSLRSPGPRLGPDVAGSTK